MDLIFFLQTNPVANLVKETQLPSSYFPIGIQLLFAIGMVSLILVITHLAGPKRPTAQKLENFESGIEIHGNARQPMAVKYFLVAILFVLFDLPPFWRVAW